MLFFCLWLHSRVLVSLNYKPDGDKSFTNYHNFHIVKTKFILVSKLVCVEGNSNNTEFYMNKLKTVTLPYQRNSSTTNEDKQCWIRSEIHVWSLLISFLKVFFSSSSNYFGTSSLINEFQLQLFSTSALWIQYFMSLFSHR